MKKHLLKQCCLLLAIGIGLGLLINAGYWWRGAEDPSAAQEMAADYLPVPVDAPGVVQWQRKKGLIVDARSAEAYAEGHVPTAYSVPRGDRSALSNVVDCCLNQGQVLVYCSSEQCNDSFVVGEELFRAGFTTVLLYEEGFADWLDRGLAIERGMP